MRTECPNCDADVDENDLFICEECGDLGCERCVDDGLCERCQAERDDPNASVEDDYDPEDYDGNDDEDYDGSGE